MPEPLDHNLICATEGCPALWPLSLSLGSWGTMEERQAVFIYQEAGFSCLMLGHKQGGKNCTQSYEQELAPCRHVSLPVSAKEHPSENQHVEGSKW